MERAFRAARVPEEGLASLLVVGAGARGSVQAEAELADGERRGDCHAGAAVEGDLDWAAAENRGKAAPSNPAATAA